MTTRAHVDAFLGLRRLALAGASTSGRKFGNIIARELRARGREVFQLHPTADSVDGHPAWQGLGSLPEPVEGLVLVVPPVASLKLLQEAHGLGILDVWIQQGAGSPETSGFCAEHGMRAVTGHCLLMFLEPVAWGHRLHRGLWRLLGRLPR